MKSFSPHEYQGNAIRFGAPLDRFNLLMSPGMGKTATSIEIMNIRSFVTDSYPALAIGPLRVANSVWNREVGKWANFKGLRVSKILGTLQERIAALNTPADIYTIHYGLLTWLHKYLEETGKKWPFKTVLADECFPAGTQVLTPTGSVAIEVLEPGDVVLSHEGPRKVANKYVTKTNELVRLHFSNGAYVDATLNHPFLTPSGWLPASDCEGQVVYSADAVRIMQCHLRETVGGCKTQSELGRVDVLQQEMCDGPSHATSPRYAGEIKGDNAEDRPTGMEQGASLVGRDPRENQPREERPEADCARRQRTGVPDRTTGSSSDPERVSVGVRRTDQDAEGFWLPLVIQARLRQSDDNGRTGSGRLLAQLLETANTGSEEGRVLEVVRVERFTSDQHSSQGVVYNLEVEDAHTFFAEGVLVHNCTRLKHARPSFRKHPKTGKVSLYIAGSANAGALARYAVQTPFWINMTGTYTPNGLQDAWGQQWFIDFGAALGSSYDAYTRRWFYQRRGTSAEQAVFEPHDHALDEITERLKPSSISVDAYDWFDVEKPREVDIEVELPSKLMKEYRKLHREAMLKLENETVITAVNAGAICGKCLQYASGNVYDADKNSHFIHNEKLDALESLQMNLNGAPLLVGYHYIPTREAILKRFPMAELLPSDKRQKEVEDRWNAGKIPMLVVHPSSAGHGLDLQHGGHNLCIVDPYWDFEMYAQLIERIGPVRQMQAGYDRLVHVYRLRAIHTFDDVVIDRLTSKASIESAVRGAMIQ